MRALLLTIFLLNTVCFAVGNDVYVYTKTKLGYFADLNAYVTSKGTTPTTLDVGTSWTVTGSLVIPSTFVLGSFYNTGKIYGSTGSAVDQITIESVFDVPPIQCFDTSITVIVKKANKIYTEWFGLSKTSTDNTRAIQAALNQTGTILFPAGTYITKQLLLSSNSKLIFAPACTLQQHVAEASTSVINMLYIGSKDNIEIDGSGSAMIRGYRANTSEGRMCIRIDSDSTTFSENIYIHDIRLENIDGDGIYIGNNQNSNKAVPKNIKIERVISKNNRRQGYSIISAEDLSFIDCVAESIGVVNGTAPSDGWDVEPDTGMIANIVFDRCVAKYCNGSGFDNDVSNYYTPGKAKQQVTISYINCKAIGNNVCGFRINEVLGENGKIRVENCIAEGNRQNGIKVGNFSVYSRLDVDGFLSINNGKLADSSAWQYPVWLVDSLDTFVDIKAKADILIYSSESSIFDAMNNSKGLKCGNIGLKNIQVYNDSANVLPFYCTSFEGTSGIARPPIRKVTVDNLMVKTVTNRLPQTPNDDYAQDILFTNTKIWDTLTCSWFDASRSYTSNFTLNNDSCQGIWLNNAGASAIVTLTLPGCQADSGKQQRFNFECKDADGLKVGITTDDRIQDQDQRISTMVSYDLGSRIRVEKVNANTWKIVERTGVWYSDDILLLTDANYTASSTDFNKWLSNENWGASRVITLPEITANNLGAEIGFINRNSTTAYFMKILPYGTDQIYGLANAGGDTIQALSLGSTLRLKAVTAGGGSLWMVVSQHNGWGDIKGTRYAVGSSKTAFLDTNNSTSTSNGSIVVAGGGGFMKDLRVGGNVYASAFVGAGASKISADTLQANNEIVFPTRWKDMDQFNLSAAKAVGATGFPPLVSTGNGFSQYQIGKNDSAQGHIEQGHEFVEADSDHVHVHYLTGSKEAGATFVNWSAHVRIRNKGDSLTYDTTLIKQDTIAANTSTLTHKYFEIGVIPTPLVKIGSSREIMIKRIAASPSTDPSVSPYILQVGIHRKLNTLGSHLETTK